MKNSAIVTTAVLAIFALSCSSGKQESVPGAGIDGIVRKSTYTYHRVDLSSCSTISLRFKPQYSSVWFDGDGYIKEDDAKDVQIICDIHEDVKP